MKSTFLYLLLALSHVAYGYQPSYQPPENDHSKTPESKAICRIIEEQPESIAFFHDHKYYLKSEHIRVTPSGIILSNLSSSIPLSNLHSNDVGCYLASEFKENQQGPVLIPVICKNCGTGWFYSDFRKVCPKCNTPP
ncbi:MAG: hypothetical protein K1X28_10155 [Parachlamydiales bacterium]|nr:hypothetical protein [Parachlamydiales bacterium]